MNASTDPPGGGKKGRETRQGRGSEGRRRPFRRRCSWQPDRRFRRRRCRRRLDLLPDFRGLNESRREAERKSERGAGTVLTVGFLFVICTFTVVLLMVASTCASIAKAQNAADMVALASAQRNAAGLGGCPSSAYVERTYGTSLVACDVDGALAKVKVSKNLTYMGVTYVAEAWAGPAYSAGEKG
mgnify:FL=1